MDRIQPPPNYFGAPYPQQGEMGPHTNFAPPPSMQNMNSERKDAPTTNKNPYTPVEENEYLTKFMEGNIGQKVKVYCSFTDSAQWHDMFFEGVVFAAGDDFLIIYDENKKIHTLIMAVYILFIEFMDINKNK